MNNFYHQPKILLWFESLLLLVLGFYPAIVIIELSFDQPWYYLLFLIYLPLGQFCVTPILRLSGVYKYYSPMLLGYMPNKIEIDLHSGTSFDYLFVMTKYKPGIESRNQILTYHLEGLLKIIQDIENGVIPPTVNLVGTSYFFNKRTLEKLGFEIKQPSLFYMVNLWVNIFDLIWMYSLSQGRFSIPRLSKASQASIVGSKLTERKEYLIELHRKLMEKS